MMTKLLGAAKRASELETRVLLRFLQRKLPHRSILLVMVKDVCDNLQYGPPCYYKYGPLGGGGRAQEEAGGVDEGFSCWRQARFGASPRPMRAHGSGAHNLTQDV